MIGRKFYSVLILYFAVMCCLCNRTVVVGMESETEASALFAAKEGWPQDTAGSIRASGTARVSEAADHEQRMARAEYSALLRIRTELISRFEIPSEKMEERLFLCIEENASRIHAIRDTMPDGAAKASILIPRENIQYVVDCILR
jgi:hypothetical protein